MQNSHGSFGFIWSSHDIGGQVVGGCVCLYSTNEQLLMREVNEINDINLIYTVVLLI